jgi:hypothetical protein
LGVGGAAAWNIPNLSTGQSADFSYFGTFDPSIPAGSRVIGGSAVGLPSGGPIPIPNPIPPPNFSRPPATIIEFIACVADAAKKIPPPQNTLACIEAAKKCLDAVDACAIHYTDQDTCLLPVASCLSAIVYCSPLNACLPSSFPYPFFPPWIGSRDPNDLVGPSGVGSQRWTSGSQPLTYGISFGNELSATAPAQRVVVTQPLSASLDLNTLRLLTISLPNGGSSVQIPIREGALNPAAGVNTYTTVVDLRPVQNLLVSVVATLNQATTTLNWTLSSIDAATGLPPINPLIGLLPPGLGGSVAFSVTPAKGLPTGTQVSDQAAVVFDANAPLSTPTWINTIDNSPPTSQVAALPANQSCSNFKLSWSGSDVGSGAGGFTIYSSDNGGPFAPWQSNTTATTGTFIGAIGHTYSFYSIAQDLAGNVQPGKTSADTTTSVTSTTSCAPPNLTAQVLSTTRTGDSVAVSLQLTNAGLTTAPSVNLSQIVPRTLSGSGTVALTSPTLPAAEGSLAVGASITVPLVFSVPSTVTRFSITENGNFSDPAGKSYNYSLGQVVMP